MRKRLISEMPAGYSEPEVDWLPVDQIATVEVTSEAPEHPVEHAFLDGEDGGWRAAVPGDQKVRIIFDAPQRIKRIRLVFVEREVERSQEFRLQWSADRGQTFHEVVWQQWNFNPQNAVREIEDYQVDLSGVTVLEICINPDRSRGQARASLSQLRLA